MDLISTTQALRDACDRLAAQSFVTVDTEFMRETTYYPKLCLIQMAAPDGTGVLVDPLADGIDLQPFVDLMADEGVVKVFHSARQDLEIIWLMGGLLPQPFFDTQVAAMVCGYGDSVSYEQLVNDVAKAKIDKSSRFTDWSRRPLSDAQLSYALSDVTHLVTVYEKLVADLVRDDRGQWLDEEMAVLTSPDTYRADPAQAWRRLSGRMRKPREIAVLMEVAAWREREAQTRNVPRGRILKDEAVIDVATSAPRSVEALGRLRSIPAGFERSRTGTDILAAVERGFARDVGEIALPERGRGRSGGNGALVELLKVLLKAVCETEGVAPKIIATVDDLEAVADDDAADVPLLQGWRRELFGSKALDLKHGRLALSAEGGRIVVRSLA
ncbi:ribonuclease D [Methylobacterium sp. E-041]|jgi:ribonuclease D|uniref:ribonuclease D n=1 Tax=unclassified Methylobacterium TaxID=2615210 RepID=UPI0011CC03C6|nr:MULTISPECIES: ribonuclease D [unclassified Methylobacterium]MCJ2005682.1 ribonuclease D [Methylobacterium sp. J-092]MCJ2042846.1 ribonuclease D [Methylobacterium sp. J-059]MCJ2107585.1 ribonuclease D [Methylobacterium sp. E-041]TXM90992.1 ribonuclease D [Methylobacterium sp. WL116]TXN39272.1 ribonuclease D [Methylobacterium sp. WL93]